MKLPGPKRWPLIGSAWTFWPVIGYENVSRLHEGYLKKYKQFGDVYVDDVFGKKIVSVFNPEDIYKMFMSERKFNPTRVSHEILMAVRRSRPNLYAAAGIVPANGDEWRVQRKAFQREVVNAALQPGYLRQLSALSREFVFFLKSQQGDAPDDVVPSLLYRLQEWALESVCLATLDTRVDLFKERRNSLSLRLVGGANSSLEALGQAEYSPWWRFLPRSRLWKTVADVDLMYYEFIREQAEKLMKAEPTERASSILKRYLQVKGHDLKDVITVTSDVIFTGVLTTPMAMAFFIYNMAVNPAKQEKLYEEIKRCYPDKHEPITFDQIHKLKYLRGCFMESHRMLPVTLGTSRITQAEITLVNGQQIPAGTHILVHNQIAGMLPEYVHRPEAFVPERWSIGGGENPGYEKFVKPHTYLVLPFGSGPRSCLGRRLAELEMTVLAVQLLRHYRVAWLDKEPLGIVTKMISVPNRPLALRLNQRND